MANSERSERLKRRNKRKQRTAAQLAGVQKAKLTRQKKLVALAAARAAVVAAQAARFAAAEEYRRNQEKVTSERLKVFKDRLVYTDPNGLLPISKEERGEVERILEIFAQSCRDYTPLKIERVCNDTLEAKFEETRRMLRRAKRDTKEVFMFHGTSEHNIKRYVP